MKLRIVRANPAGNITLFVLDPVAAPERARLSAALLARSELRGEQVAFVCPPCCGGDGRFEMMGGEFCGNAARSMGLLLARWHNASESVRFMVEVGGCEAPVAVHADPIAGAARANMPLPRSERWLDIHGAEGMLVDLGGIVHFVTRRAPDITLLSAVEAALAKLAVCAEAFGVIFLHGDCQMTPLVKVQATGTVVWEGSCGSGSIAAAVMESRALLDGEFSREYRQPAGTIRAELLRCRGSVARAAISGAVTLEEETVVEI